MSYSCLEELQVDLDLHALDKTSILSKIGSKYDDGWLVVTDDGICNLFDRNGNLDDIKKITRLNKEYLRKDIIKIIIPDSIIRIESYTFDDCSNLMSVIIQDSVTSIEDYAFAYCKSLTSIMIPGSVTSIRRSAFSYCDKLMNITIGNGVMSIGEYVFFCCGNLTNVTIPGSVKSIGSSTFIGCINLINLTFEGKTLEQVKKMEYYPWGIVDESIIKVK